MKTFFALTKRNIKVFFKDKGMFFTSLITPVILLVLYVTFLAKVYRDSFASALPDGMSVPEKLVNGMVAGELVTSLLAVSCVTVAFCSNLLMVMDKISGARKDFLISPTRKSTIAAAYFRVRSLRRLSSLTLPRRRALCTLRCKVGICRRATCSSCSWTYFCLRLSAQLFQASSTCF